MIAFTLYDGSGLTYNRSPMISTAPKPEAKITAVTTERGYIPQLDALRFFAILGVLVTHEWYPDPLPWIFGGLDPGHVGVRLFFVLSGFLITGILLDCRRRAEERGHRKSVLIRRFYARRSLRIYPLYYAVLAVIIVAGAAPAREVWPWLATYTTNIYIWHHQQWIGNAGIFWTLAVEEQFYLMWPLLVLFVPRRWLIPVLVGLISLAPAFRLWASIHQPADLTLNGYTSGTFTLAVFDCLGMGALLAILSQMDSTRARLHRWLNRFALPVGAVGVIVLLASHYYGGPATNFVLGETFLALVLCWLVGSASRGFTGTAGRLLEWKPFSYLGKISYGIYALHAFVPLLLIWIGHRFGREYYGAPRLVNFVIVSTVTISLAALSWKLFEGPINNLKRYFPYRDDRRPSPAPPPLDLSTIAQN
jgi:peptidoglycan/LPS O-acetylase OafA/YrhL